MNMPGLNGFEVLTALRQANCVSPVIFMTVAGSERIAVEAFRLGVRDYLSKPFTEAELRQSIDRALSETRLVCERDRLTRNLVMAEAVRSTIVTLSHYLNNYLTSLNGGLQLLEENLRNDQVNSDTSPITSPRFLTSTNLSLPSLCRTNTSSLPSPTRNRDVPARP